MPEAETPEQRASFPFVEKLGVGLGSVLLLALVLGAVWSFLALNLHQQGFRQAWQGLGALFDISLPPDTGVLKLGLIAMQETLYIAYLGTLLGVGASLPVSLLASRNLFPWYVNLPARWALAGVRVLPSLIWAILFVIVVGSGSLAGVLAISLYTVGFVGKLEYEAFEGLDAEPMEAVGSLGASRFQVLRFVVIPQAINALVSQAFFMFEYNVRHASIIGIVGAGGIGYYLIGYLDMLVYDRVLVLLGIIFVTVIVIDEASHWVRSSLLGESKARLKR